MTDHDDLVARVRARAADPERRLELRSSAFGAMVGSLDLSGLFEMGRSIQQDLARVVEGGAAAVDADMQTRLDGLLSAMSTPADEALPAPASADALDAAERALGFALPPLLRRLFAEVANGGFGPGEGIIGVAGGWTDTGKDLVEAYAMFVEGPYEVWDWPEGLLPLCHLGDGAYAFVDASDPAAPVCEWDEEIYDEDEDEDAPTGPELSARRDSLAAWLEEWLATEPGPSSGVGFAIGPSPFGPTP